jgi:hypothetical protein
MSRQRRPHGDRHLAADVDSGNGAESRPAEAPLDRLQAVPAVVRVGVDANVRVA